MADQRLVNSTYANLGKSLAAYQRGIRLLPLPLERYAAGAQTALSPEQKDGLWRFFDPNDVRNDLRVPFLRTLKATGKSQYNSSRRL